MKSRKISIIALRGLNTSMKNKTKLIIHNAIPIFVMMSLIPIVANDYLLSLVYIFVIIISFVIHKEKNEIKVYIFGFCIMILSEALFISTGVEIFVRNSLLGLMLLWLPLLWGYCFVAMKRAIKILEI